MFNHVMLDLETLSLKNNAAIFSIGAVKMDLKNFTLGPEFYIPVKPESSEAAGLHVSVATLKWWTDQSSEAKRVFTDTQAVSLGQALGLFDKFVRSDAPIEGIWGHGSAFDNVILRNAYAALGYQCPWSHRMDLCFRTMRVLFPMPQPEDKGVVHNALDDARRQARSLCAGLQRLRACEAAYAMLPSQE